MDGALIVMGICAEVQRLSISLILILSIDGKMKYCRKWEIAAVVELNTRSGCHALPRRDIDFPELLAMATRIMAKDRAGGGSVSQCLAFLLLQSSYIF